MDKIGDYEVNSKRWLSLEDFDGEVWMGINGCNTHLISNYGRVKSLERKIQGRGSGYRIGKTCILKVRTYFGYLKVSLLINGKTKLVSVHRLVAEAFIANPQNLPVINHKNEIKHDNRAINLEWCTTKYNINYGTGRNRSAMKKMETHGKAICQYRKNGELVMKHQCVTVAARQTGYDYRGISKACKGKSMSYKGFVWRYEEEPFDKYQINRDYKNQKKPKCRTILQYSKDGKLIRVFEDGIRDIRKAFGKSSSIHDCIEGKTLTAYGYIWRYDGQEAPKPIERKKRIVQYSLDYEVVAIHNSLTEAAKSVMAKHSTSISNCLQGRTTTSLGFIWKYEDEGTPLFRRINQMNLDGTLVRQYKTIGEVLRQFGQKKMSPISQCINGKAKSAFGFKWVYD